MVALNAEILCQIDDLDILRDGMFLQEGFTLAVPKAEEYNVDLLKGHLVSKLQFRLANKPFMHIADQIACVTFRIGKHNLCLRMIQQQTDEFTSRITCSS